MTERVKKDFDRHRQDMKLKILVDDAPVRVIQVRREGTIHAWFDIVTWPGHLTIAGDYGSFTFNRLNDMFEFFGSGGINPGYWSEKLQACEKGDGYEEYSQGLFEKYVLEAAESYTEEFSEKRREQFMEQLEEEVLSQGDDGEQTAMRAAMDFCFKGEQAFPDFWEVSCRRCTFHYLWCLYAIVWTIGEYRKMKEKNL